MKDLLEYGNSAKKVSLKDDITLEILVDTICQTFDLVADRLKLQVLDKDFDAFCDLESIQDVTNFGRIKVIDRCVLPEENKFEVAEYPIDNTLKNLRKKMWSIGNFNLSSSCFCLLSREELSEAENLYQASKKLHVASYRLRRDIMDVLSKELCSYTMYPTEDMYKDIVGILITTYPFLQNAIGDGSSGWKIALWYRMQEVRRKTKADEAKVNLGIPSNKVARKLSDHKSPLRSKGIKKARKGELNYAPQFPDGETLETLEEHKRQLCVEGNKKEWNETVLKQKMAVTFALRRREIIRCPTTLENFKNQWPVLFSTEMLRKEMVRLVGFDIHNKILYNVQNEALLEITKKRMSIEHVSGEAVLKSLPKIFNEKWSFYIEKADYDETSLFSEDLIDEQIPIPPHPVIIEASPTWSIMGENTLLLEGLDFLTAVICLISIYYVCDLNYNEQGLKSMLFLQVALAEIPSSRKLPVKVNKMLSTMKLSNQANSN